jgi:regulator of replication initiation timing
MSLVVINEMKNAQLQEELKKMKIENQRLRDMLSQATTNFNALQMQLVAVMRQQEQRNSSQDHLLVMLQ